MFRDSEGRFMLGNWWIHRLEQYDLDCFPLVCVHRRTPNRSKRIFCLWERGIQIGGFMLTTRAIHLTPRRVIKFRA